MSFIVNTAAMATAALNKTTFIFVRNAQNVCTHTELELAKYTHNTHYTHIKC